MTRTVGAPADDRPGPDRLARRLLGALVLPGLLMVGPVVGVLLGALIFGLPRDLLWAALVMFLLGLALLSLLARGEWRALSRRR